MSGTNLAGYRCGDDITYKDERLTKLESDKIEIIRKFGYVGDMHGRYDITNKALTSRIRA